MTFYPLESRDWRDDVCIGYRNAGILMTVIFVIYTAIFFQAMKISRGSKTPYNIFSAHRAHVTRGGGSTRARTALLYAAVLMYLFTFVVLVCTWIKSSPKYIYISAPGTIIQIFTSLTIIISDVILIWRISVIIGHNIPIIALPVLGVLAELALLFACAGISDFLEQEAGVPGGYITYILPIVSFCTTVYCTIVIAVRLIREKSLLNGMGMRTMGSALEIIVESALLYSTVLLAHVLVASLTDKYNGDVEYVYTQALVICAAGMSPTLIVARVMSGKSCYGAVRDKELNLTATEVDLEHTGKQDVDFVQK
ncbi:hypothetical protein CYLTODRAFT_494655 [Cylindrobasidium torrendii FP15055 ss-10]|uniref:Uncharacterized protein n=1 Tax=Cylindrobasidium torrendii FP15055 ss-10 TaxID=1314674 RepID=A0A0D7AW27_9AGAR|nr:hypothetical protein CYLTODRAFT_494655 [Cylindrobasidium torrendii FP15055 ss-10]